MLDLVAKESSTDVALRFIITGRAVFNCKRKNDESHANFSDRFRGIAQGHLNCFQRPPSEQGKQHLALVLLDNAGLPNTNYNNLLSILVNKAERSDIETSHNGMVSDGELASVYKLIENCTTFLHEVSGSEIVQDHVRISNNVNEELKKAKSEISPMLKRIVSSCKIGSAKLNFSLEETYAALKDIRADSGGPKLVPDLEPPNPTKGLLSNRINIQPSPQRGVPDYKLISRCASCNGKGHWARDPECPLKKSCPKERKGSKRKDVWINERYPKKMPRFKNEREETESNDSDENDSPRQFFRN